MNVLLIGAGAVGQSYGYHFQRGGAEVSFFVREKYAEEARRGFDLYPLNRPQARKAPVRLEGFDVLTDMNEVAQHTWDMVVLCVPGPALRSGSWLSELGPLVGDATLVNLTPDLEDYELVAQHVPEAQIVNGMIGLSSWSAPLPGATLPKPGIAYWVPPFTKMGFSGSKDRTRAVVDALNAGGLASKEVGDAREQSAFGSPILQCLVAVLELCDWRFDELRRRRDLLTLHHRATHEAFAIASKRLGKPVPLGVRLIRPWILRLATRLVRFVAPFDMAVFLEKHFTKVGDQTELRLRTVIATAEAQGQSSAAIRELLDALVAARAQDAPGDPSGA